MFLEQRWGTKACLRQEVFNHNWNIGAEGIPGEGILVPINGHVPDQSLWPASASAEK